MNVLTGKCRHGIHFRKYKVTQNDKSPPNMTFFIPKIGQILNHSSGAFHY